MPRPLFQSLITKASVSELGLQMAEEAGALWRPWGFLSLGEGSPACHSLVINFLAEMSSRCLK